jgi:hypothetical protein
MDSCLGELYMRSAEYTCDRYESYYTNNLEASINSLTILAIGKRLFQKVNKEDFLLYYRKETGFFVFLSKLLSTHPPLPRRIEEITLFFEQKESEIFNKKKAGQIVWIVIGSTVLSILVISGVRIYLLLQFQNGDWLETDEYSLVGSLELINAVVYGDLEEVKELTETLDVNEQDELGDTALHWSVMAGDVKITKLILETEANPNLENFDGETPLFLASGVAGREMIELLVRHGADPNYINFFDETPIFQSIYNNNTESLKALLDVGANPVFVDQTGWTPLKHAMYQGNHGMVKILREYR